MRNPWLRFFGEKLRALVKKKYGTDHQQSYADENEKCTRHRNWKRLKNQNGTPWKSESRNADR